MEQVERLLGMTALGLVPALKGLKNFRKRPESYILEQPASALGESIRSLRTSLMLTNLDRPPRVIMVTSSVPQEGKTAVSLSLARLFASIGQKVVVVDCDLRRPAAHKSFGLDLVPGLVEHLSGELPLEAVIKQDTHSATWLIPAGRAAANPPELLGSEEMKRLLKRLSENYDLVIVDSAPVLAVSDSLILCRQVDKTVFVVRWARTRRETATRGLRQVLEAGGDVAGVLLTAVDVKKHAQYGYSDSGYYYGRARKYYTG
jgi:capsular exopolysaccharide synthesis family protein